MTGLSSRLAATGPTLEFQADFDLESRSGDWALAENTKRLTEEIYVEQSADDSFSPRPKAVDSEALLERIL